MVKDHLNGLLRNADLDAIKEVIINNGNELVRDCDGSHVKAIAVFKNNKGQVGALLDESLYSLSPVYINGDNTPHLSILNIGGCIIDNNVKSYNNRSINESNEISETVYL